MEEINTIYNDKQQKEDYWKEIMSKGGDTNTNSDARSLLVYGALGEKLETKHKALEKPGIEIQLEKSKLNLQELIKFGNELVNNIKSSHEHHELLRSKKIHEKGVELQENLRKEGELSLSQFNEISQKWKDMKNLKEPMGIYEDMQRQRENIEHLLASKNELIEQCEHELEQVNKKYYHDQDAQSEGICLLVERVEHQISLLKKSYRSSVNDLQNTIEQEKQTILQSGQEKWNIVYDQLMEKEADKMETLKEKRKFYLQELDNTRNKQEEITRTTKIRLEKDAELLETEIRKTQANILMNSEKIDYNYQVLQKRNEENIIINNHQKRRVAKLNEQIVALKKKLASIKADNAFAMGKLTLDIEKLHSSINELHTKSEHFRQNNSIKLGKIWHINYQEIKHLVTRVLAIDRILYEQQLGREWKRPNIDLNKLDYTKYVQPRPNTKTTAVKQHKTKPAIRLTHQKYLHDILFKISDRAGFLIEDKLLEILAPYADEDQCLVKIEGIFAALNVTNIEDVKSLMKYFEPYSRCKTCSSGSPINSPKTSSAEEGNSTTVGGGTNSSRVACNNHIPYMEPAFVLSALNDFMSRGAKSSDTSAEPRKSENKSELNLPQIAKSDILSYWQNFAAHISMEQQNIWKSIEHGLNHYLEVLKKRAQIDNECIFLKTQNAELKYLLQKL